MGRFGTPPELLFEPFAGGGIVSLTAVMEGLAERALMAELDHDVAAFWRAALRSAPAIKERVQRFEPTREAVNALAARSPKDEVEHDMEFLMTYDYAPEIAALVKKHAFHAVQVIMKNTHHAKLAELVITKQPVFDAPCP